MSFGPERIARPVYCYPSYASVPRSASNHHVSCLSGFFFQTLSASSTHLSSLYRFGCHTCSSHSPASRSEAIDVITKSWCRLFHARNYFFTKFQKNIKNILSSLLCNVAAAKKFCIGELFNVIRPSRLPIRTNIAPRNTIFPPAPQKNIRRQELAAGYFHIDSLLSMPTTQRADSRSSWH